jgi:hypothetical protein
MSAMRDPRLRLLAVPLLLLLAAGAGCAPAFGMLSPGQVSLYKPGARVHGFQTASFAYSFMHGHQVQWLATLDRVERDALPLLGALRDAGHAARVVMRPAQASDGIEHYHVDLEITAKGSADAPGKTARVEGTTGMSPEQHSALSAEAAEVTGMSAELITKGHFALYGLVNMLTALNASVDSLERHAFALLVLKQKVSAGEKADWFDGNRPPEETIADVHSALQIIADHHATAAAWRGEILAMVAMAGSHAVPGALDELRAQIEESRGRSKQWEATHAQPTVDDFGVKVSLPDPQRMLDELEEKVGFLSAVAKVARGVATGSPSATLEGLAKLAPAGSSIKTALEGAAAATRGDVMGTIDAVAKLAGKEAELEAVKGVVDGVKGRLSRVQEAAAAFKAGQPMKGLKAAGAAAGGT